MSIFSSDYQSRTREMINARGQSARETAVSAAAQIVASVARTTDTVESVTNDVLSIAKSLEEYIALG